MPTAPCPRSGRAIAGAAGHAGARIWCRKFEPELVSIDGLYKALGEARRADIRPGYCDACFTGDYPTRLTDQEQCETIPQLRLVSEANA